MALERMQPLLLDKHVRQLVRLQSQVVCPFEVLILQRRAGLRDIAANLRHCVLLIAAQAAGEAAQILFRRIQQFRGALLCLRSGVS